MYSKVINGADFVAPRNQIDLESPYFVYSDVTKSSPGRTRPGDSVSCGVGIPSGFGQRAFHAAEAFEAVSSGGGAIRLWSKGGIVGPWREVRRR